MSLCAIAQLCSGPVCIQEPCRCLMVAVRELFQVGVQTCIIFAGLAKFVAEDVNGHCLSPRLKGGAGFIGEPSSVTCLTPPDAEPSVASC